MRLQLTEENAKLKGEIARIKSQNTNLDGRNKEFENQFASYLSEETKKGNFSSPVLTQLTNEYLGSDDEHFEEHEEQPRRLKIQ